MAVNLVSNQEVLVIVYPQWEIYDRVKCGRRFANSWTSLAVVLGQYCWKLELYTYITLRLEYRV